ASGFVVYALGDDEEQVARFIRDGNRALLTPVSATDAEHLAAHLASEPVEIARSASEAALAQCAGEPLYAPDSAGMHSSAADVSKWLDSLLVGDVAFSVVGSRKYLDSATRAAASLTAWTRLGTTSWKIPDADQLGSVRAPGPLTLSVALSG